MKAIRIHEYGGPELLRYEDVDVPKVGRGQVLVRVHAASVNPVDYKHASGVLERFFLFEPPWIPGRDFSGVIEQIGSGVKRFQIGDAVFGNAAGCYAQFIVVQADRILPKPPQLSHVEASSIPLAAQTAWEALFTHGHLRAGQTILIHAASGGVGTFAVQLAHWKNAKVLATASLSNKEYLELLGADIIIDYNHTPFETIAKEMDVVLDTIGDEVQEKSFLCLKRGGYLVATTQEPEQEQADRYKVHAEMMHTMGSPQLLNEILGLIQEGHLRTVVTKTYPLSQASDAWIYMMAKHARGKIVLTVC